MLPAQRVDARVGRGAAEADAKPGGTVGPQGDLLGVGNEADGTASRCPFGLPSDRVQRSGFDDGRELLSQNGRRVEDLEHGGLTGDADDDTALAGQRPQSVDDPTDVAGRTVSVDSE